MREERIFMYMLIYLSYIQTGEFRDELDVYDNLFTIYTSRISFLFTMYYLSFIQTGEFRHDL